MKILKNSTYRELFNSNARLHTRLNSEISENNFLKNEIECKKITILRLHEKASKYDAEMERQRIKNQKYRDAKKQLNK